MKYEEFIDWLTIMAVLVSGLEKLASYFGQQMFPEYIGESNKYAMQVCAVVGLEWGHVLFFVASVVIAVALRWLFIKPKRLFKKHRKLEVAYMVMCAASFIYIIAITTIVFISNLLLLCLLF